MNWPGYHYEMTFFITASILYSEINIATEVFLWLVLTWYIFSHTFTCNLIMPL